MKFVSAFPLQKRTEEYDPCEVSWETIDEWTESDDHEQLSIKFFGGVTEYSHANMTRVTILPCITVLLSVT